MNTDIKWAKKELNSKGELNRASQNLQKKYFGIEVQSDHNSQDLFVIPEGKRRKKNF
jgi:hypothetical protein